MTDLRELYQDIILDHGQHPRNFKKPALYSHDAHGHNPLCGDQVSVYVTIEDGVIKDVHFHGRGCAISMASASLMTEVQCGKTLAQAKSLFQAFQRRVMGEESPALDGLEEEVERLEPLSGVRAYPTRVKCAVLPWHTLMAALERAGEGRTK